MQRSNNLEFKKKNLSIEKFEKYSKEISSKYRKYQNIHKDIYKSKSEGKRYQKYFKMHGFININVQYSNLFYNDLSI